MIGWWWLLKKKHENQPNLEIKVDSIVLPEDEPGADDLTAVEASQGEMKTSLTEESQNLKLIEGIGPRSASALAAAGVQTFAKLAALTPDEIQAILRKSGVRIPSTGTWPEQAALAAASNWEALKKLQGSLKGGHRV